MNKLLIFSFLFLFSIVAFCEKQDENIERKLNSTTENVTKDQNQEKNSKEKKNESKCNENLKGQECEEVLEYEDTSIIITV